MTTLKFCSSRAVLFYVAVDIIFFRYIVFCRVFCDQLQPLIHSEFEESQVQVKVKKLFALLYIGFTILWLICLVTLIQVGVTRFYSCPSYVKFLRKTDLLLTFKCYVVLGY
jgi:hypothetical protein